MSLHYATRAIGQITNAAGTSGTSLVVATGQGARFLSGAQERRARLYSVNNGAVEHVTITNLSSDTFTVTRNADAGGAQDITASGWVLEDIDDLGPWHAVAFDSSFFAAVGGGTWGVASGDMLQHRWRRLAYGIEYEVSVTTSSITGTVTALQILVPTAAAPSASGFSGAHPCVIFDNNLSVGVLGFYYILNGTNIIEIKKADGAAFTASTNQTAVAIQAVIGIS